MTAHHLCDQLDEYLAGDLAGPSRAAFEQHLAGCPRCRENAENYARLAGVLQSAARQAVECPPSLPARIRREVSRRQFQRRVGVAVAAAVLAAVAGFAWMAGGASGPAAPRQDRMDMAEGENRQRDADGRPQPRPNVAGSVTVAPLPRAPESSPVQTAAVSIEFSDDVIGVPVETDDPSITILWVYPTIGRVSRAE